VAWRFNTDIRALGQDTDLKASIECVGPNYSSLGAPVLLNDLLRWKVDLRQSFLNGQLRLGAFARRDANSLDPLLSSVSSVTQSFGLNATLAMRHLPSITFYYTPYAQNNDVVSSNESFESDSRILNAVLNYPLRISEQLSLNTQLNFMNQDMDSNIPEVNYSLTMYGLSQSILFKRNSLNVSLNYTPNQIISDDEQEVLSMNVSGSFQLLEKWNNSIGLQYLDISDTESRTGYFITSSYPINNMFDVKLRIQRNIYDTRIEAMNSIREFIAWMSLRARW